LLNAVVVWFLARDVFGVAWGATTDAEMVVFEVALISNAAEYADCYEENIIIISTVDVDFVVEAPWTIET